jgi:hypothetical protein
MMGSMLMLRRGVLLSGKDDLRFSGRVVASEWRLLGLKSQQ